MRELYVGSGIDQSVQYLKSVEVYKQGESVQYHNHPYGLRCGSLLTTPSGTDVCWSTGKIELTSR